MGPLKLRGAAPARAESSPTPWDRGENLPWQDPRFSERMLREHLSQRHDGASRRFEIIDRQVQWIDHALLRLQK